MKKTYIQPKSQLFAINLTENIAFSGAMELSGIKINRGNGFYYYANDPTARVSYPIDTFEVYFLIEFGTLCSQKNNPPELLSCYLG